MGLVDVPFGSPESCSTTWWKTIQLGEFRLLKAILYMFVIYINT